MMKNRKEIYQGSRRQELPKIVNLFHVGKIPDIHKKRTRCKRGPKMLI